MLRLLALVGLLRNHNPFPAITVTTCGLSAVGGAAGAITSCGTGVGEGLGASEGVGEGEGLTLSAGVGDGVGVGEDSLTTGDAD